MAKFKAGERLGRHEIVRFIGAGGMGEVYEARHVDLKKRVAIKCLLDDVQGFEEVKRRFQQEGEAAARIHHPNVVTVFDVGVESSIAYIVMEFLEGVDLQDRLKAGPLTGTQLVEIMLPVCSAISAAHAAGVFHRDIKPANIFLARNPLGGAPTPKLLDFGISKISSDPTSVATVSSTVLGTAQYLAPEQALGLKGFNVKLDQYALGVMMYQCLSNKLPFSGESVYLLMNAIVQGTPVPIHEHAPALDQRLGDVVMRAMARDAQHRFASVRHLGMALLPFASPHLRQTWAGTFEDGAPEGDRAATVIEAAPKAEPRASEPPKTSVFDAREEARLLADPGIPYRTADSGGPGATGGPLRLSKPRGPVVWAALGASIVAGIGALALWVSSENQVIVIPSPSPTPTVEPPKPSPTRTATAAAPPTTAATSATPTPTTAPSPVAPSPTPTKTPSTPTKTPSPTPTKTPSPSPTKTPSPSPTPEPSQSPSPRPSTGSNGSPIIR